MSRVLVAYFSATGATAKVAAELAEAENADCFEIRPRQPYTAEDLDYTKKDSRCNLEMADEKCRPEMDGRIDGMSGYEVVFLGFPIWWGREPSIVDTFLDAHYFVGKTIVPFCTSGVTGVEKAAEHIRSIIGADAIVEDGRRLGADATEEDIRLWTELLGF